LPQTQLQLVYDHEIRIFKNPHCFPRAFFVPHARLAATPQQAYQLVGSFASDDFRRTVVLEAGQDQAAGCSDSPQVADTAAAVALTHRGANTVAVTVTCSTPGFLVISNNYHPGWKADVDGKATRVMHANYIMQAVALPAGKHEVRFTFRPTLIIAGLAFTGSSWCIIIAVLFIGLLQRQGLSFRLPLRPDRESRR
jgi:hypothetical protein